MCASTTCRETLLPPRRGQVGPPGRMCVRAPARCNVVASLHTSHTKRCSSRDPDTHTSRFVHFKTDRISVPGDRGMEALIGCNYRISASERED